MGGYVNWPGMQPYNWAKYQANKVVAGAENFVTHVGNDIVTSTKNAAKSITGGESLTTTGVSTAFQVGKTASRELNASPSELLKGGAKGGAIGLALSFVGSFVYNFASNWSTTKPSNPVHAVPPHGLAWGE